LEFHLLEFCSGRTGEENEIKIFYVKKIVMYFCYLIGTIFRLKTLNEEEIGERLKIAIKEIDESRKAGFF